MGRTTRIFIITWTGSLSARYRSFSFSVTTVEPGEHYVTSNGENNETILLNFKPGTTYYLKQERSMGFSLPRTRYIQVKGDRVFNDMKGKCSCYASDAQDSGADLDEDKFKEIVAAYIRKRGNIPFNEVEPSKFIKWEGKTIRVAEALVRFSADNFPRRTPDRASR